jgi:hypothetical protein
MLGKEALNWTKAKYKKIMKASENFIKGFKKFDFTQKSKNKAIELFYGLNEKEQRGLPKEDQIIEKYSDIDEYNKLTNKIDITISNVKKIIDNMGEGAIYSMPDFKYPKKMDKKTIRFVYYNAVSIMIMEEYLMNYEKGMFLNIEREAVYGNTIMPLIKVTTDFNSPIDFLPITNSPTVKSTAPSFIFKMNITNDSYYSFYFYVISNIKTTEDNIVYLKIQMRTKGYAQYVVDAQSYVSHQQAIKDFNA